MTKGRMWGVVKAGKAKAGLKKENAEIPAAF
jgi:hypothetical protein